jgi:hypothetical protein
MSDWNRDLYRIQVASVLRGVVRDTVLNGTIEHASIVTEEAFKAASNHVRILSERLDPFCYANAGVLQAAKAFLASPDTKLDVLVEDGRLNLDQSPFVEAVRRVGGERVTVKVVPAATVQSYGFNFLTVDHKSYRFEDDRAHPIAVVGNEPGSAEHLANLFDRLFAHSEKITH